jgi:hypothetical protein
MVEELMKKIRFVLIAACVLAAAAGAAQVKAPDLSGEWKLDPGRSDLGEMAAIDPQISVSIRQEAAAIAIRKTISVPAKQTVRNFRYTLDGRESLNAGESLKDLKGKAAFEKAVLVVRSEQEGMTMRISGDDPPEIEYFKYDSVEEYSLSADGKILTVIQTGQMPDGPRKTTFVFARAAA